MNLDEFKPWIVIDSREQTPMKFTRLPSVRGSLRVADYSVHGLEHLFGIERKSVADFIACCMGDGIEYDSVKRLDMLNAGKTHKDGERARFERELLRMRAMEFSRLIIIGVASFDGLYNYCEEGRARSRINPLSVLNSARSFDAEFVPVHFFLTPEQAAEQTEEWAWWYAKKCMNAGRTLQLRMKQDEKRRLEKDIQDWNYDTIPVIP